MPNRDNMYNQCLPLICWSQHVKTYVYVCIYIHIYIFFLAALVELPYLSRERNMTPFFRDLHYNDGHANDDDDAPVMIIMMIIIRLTRVVAWGSYAFIFCSLDVAAAS